MTTKRQVALSEILGDLRSPGASSKGKALELLALRLADLLNLKFKRWALRGGHSDNREAQVIADGGGLLFSRWSIQFRDTDRMDIGDVATAVGRSVPFKPNIVLSATTGHYTRHAREYAARAMRLTNLQILLVDGGDLQALGSDERAMEGILLREAGSVTQAKGSQLAATPAWRSEVIGGQCTAEHR